jgi:DNA invertase Pin-like site-specific DNA recombinase
MKYFAYCRKSSEEESKQIQSLETQETILREYALRTNLQIVEVIKESKSAKVDGNRPLFTELLQRIQRKEAEGILVAHVDRLSRNSTECAQITKLVELGFIKEIRTPERSYSNYMDLMYIGFEFIFAEHYSRALSVRVKEGIQTKLNKGEYPSFAPIGYINKQGKIYPEKDRALMIKTAYELYATGQYSLKQLIKLLFEKGFRTRSGQKISKNTLWLILNNPAYIGLIKRNEKIYQGIHRPLITTGLYDQVQAVFKGLNRTKRQTLDFLYRPYLNCAVCGCKMTASRKKGVYEYYYCTNGKSKCDQHRKYLNNDRVQNLLQNLVSEVSLDAEMADLSFEIYAKGLETTQELETSSAEIIRRQIDKNALKLNDLLDLLLDKKISQEQYDAKFKKINSEQLTLKNQLKNQKLQNPEQTLELVEDVKNKAIKLSAMFKEGDDEVRSDLLKGLLWNLKIKDGVIASVQYRKPFLYLQNLSKTDDIEVWRRG